MDIDAAALVASLVVSAVGFVLFRFGRSQGRFPHTVTGVTLMLFPYAVSGALWIYLIGAGLAALLWIATRAGL